MRSRKLSGLLVGVVLVLCALLGLPAIPALAQTGTPTSPPPTFTPRPTFTPEAAPLPIETHMLVNVDEAGSGGALLVVEMTRLSGDWPDELELAVNLPDGINLEQASRGEENLPFTAGDAPNEYLLQLTPPDEQTQQLLLALRFDAEAPAELGPLSAVLRDPATGEELPVELPDPEQLKLESARPAAGDDAQQGPPAPEDSGTVAAEPAVTEEPAATSELAQTGDATAAVEATVAPTAIPPTAEPTAGAAATGEAVSGADAGDEAEAGMSVSQVLWILLIAGAALLFLAVVLILLLRVFRGPKQPASEPIAMRPATAAPPEATASVAGAAPPASAAGMATAATLAAIPSPILKPGHLTLAADQTQRYEIAGERFSIGRAEGNTLVIDDSYAEWDTVSRFHAAIYMQAGKTMIEDLNSHNGVWVNGQAVPKIALTDGAEVGIGGVTFIYHAGEAAGDQGGSTT